VSAWATIPLGGGLPRPSSNQPGRRGRIPHVPPLFGLAPGGVCRAGPVASPAVRSCRTLSPWPARRRAACFLWHYPWPLFAQGPPGVTRHRHSVEPGLSSPGLLPPRPPGPLAELI